MFRTFFLNLKLNLKLSLILTISLSVFSTSALAATTEFYLDSSMFAYSETAPIKQIVFDDFEGNKFEGGRHSFTHNRWELGARRNGWKAAYLIRYDYSLAYNEDTAELVYADKNNIEIEKNRNYSIKLDAIHARTTGLKLGYQWHVQDTLSLSADISYLQTSSFIDGDLNGQFTVLDDDYSGEIFLDYVYDKDKLLDRIVDEPTGKGFSLDLASEWQVNPALNVVFKATDLISRIRFDETPYTTAQASSNRVSFDSDGKIDVKPALSGQEGYRKHTLSYPRQFDLKAAYQFHSDYSVHGRWYRYDTLNFPSLGLSKSVSPSLSLRADFDLKSKASTLGAAGDNWHFSITSDRLTLENAMTFGLSFAYLLTW